MDRFTERMRLLEAESDRIKKYLHALTAPAWTRETACREWRVQDVVAHLVGVAEFYATTVSRGLTGNVSPPEGRPPAGSVNAARTADSISERTIARRAQLGDQLLAIWDATTDHLNRLLAGLGPGNRDVPCYHPGGIAPAHQFVNLRLKELALHEWDIRSRLEPGFRLSPVSHAAIIELFDGAIASASPRWAYWTAAAPSALLRYRFEVTGTLSYRIDVVVASEDVRAERPGDAPPDVTFHCDPETFILIVNGRLTAGDAVGAGRARITGDADLARRFSDWFRGI